MTIKTTVMKCAARLLRQLNERSSVVSVSLLAAAVELRRETLRDALREEPACDGVAVEHVNAVRDDGNFDSFEVLPTF